MKRRTLTTLLLGGAALAAFTARTARADGPPAKTYYSDPQSMGNGTVRTYVTLASPRLDENGGRRVPSAVGIEFPTSALQGLPATAGEDAKPWILYFPPQAKQTPFQYTMIDWNPQGHPPAEFMPAGYTNVGAVEPYMGNHLIDLSSPEFNGATFTRTFIYGAYDGKITFEESMITRDFLLSKPAECKPCGLPQAYAETGYWPTKYCTVYSPQNDTIRISLEGFVYRVAPDDVRRSR